MTELTIKLEGVETLLTRMKTLPVKLQKKGARRATRKAANVIRNAMRVRAKLIDDLDTPEQIWRNIGTQESGRAGKREGGIVMRIGVFGGSRTPRGASRKRRGVSTKSFGPGGDSRHWRHVEMGHENVPAKPFMRPAVAESVTKVFSTLTAELNIEIDKLIAGLGA